MMIGLRTCGAGALGLWLALGSAGRADDPAQFDLAFEPPDAAVAERVAEHLAAGSVQVGAFFGEPLGEPLRVSICPSREAFDASMPVEWGLAETQCWMVATGVSDRLVVLSPRVWSAQACEHDADDGEHVRDILVHELVHVYHGRHNPTGDFTGAEELGWFIEGLAVHASGQLERGRLASAREAVEAGLAPESLKTAWSGRYRYAVCGSLVRYLDVTYGRETLKRMLSATTQDQLLSSVDLTEEQLLARWRRDVLTD